MPFFLILFILLTRSLFSESDSIIIKDIKKLEIIGEKLYYLKDEAGKLRIQDVLKEEKIDLVIHSIILNLENFLSGSFIQDDITVIGIEIS